MTLREIPYLTRRPRTQLKLNFTQVYVGIYKFSGYRIAVLQCREAFGMTDVSTRLFHVPSPGSRGIPSSTAHGMEELHMFQRRYQ